MSLNDAPTADAAGFSRSRFAGRARRPWALIGAALLLAVLSFVLWVKWRDSRTRADRLQAELQQVYAEAELLRTQAVRAQQRVTQLERDLRVLAAGEGASTPASTKTRRPR